MSEPLAGVSVWAGAGKSTRLVGGCLILNNESLHKGCIQPLGHGCPAPVACCLGLSASAVPPPSLVAGVWPAVPAVASQPLLCAPPSLVAGVCST